MMKRLSFKSIRVPILLLILISVFLVFTGTGSMFFHKPILFGIVFAFALISTWLIGRMAILKRINELMDAAHRLALGDFKVRTGLSNVGGELGQLAKAFDEMADKLEQKELDRKTAEEALSESENKFRDLVEKSIIGVYLVQDGIFKYVNSRFAEIYGYEVEELIEKRGLEATTYPEDLPIVEENIRKRLSGEAEITHYEHRIITKKQEIKIVEIYGSRTIYKGKPATIGMLLDITDRKKAEEALQREKEMSSTILENSPNGIALVDNKGVYQYINAEFTNITGYTIEDVPTGKDWFLRAFPEHKYRKHVVECWKEDTAQKKEEVCKEFAVASKDGETKEIEFRTTYLKDYCIVVLNDVTRRKQAEEALKKSEEQYRRIFETTSEGIWVLDENFKISFVNARMAEMLGCEPHEPIGRGIESFTFDEDVPGLLERLKKRRQGISEQFERRMRRKDGSTLWVHGSATSIVDEQKRFLGAFTMFTDITQRKEAEQALRESEEKYRGIFENSAEGIAQTTPEGRFITVNPALASILGFASPEEMMVEVGDIERQLDVNKENRQRYWELLHKQGQVINFELQQYRKDRSKIWVSLSTKGICDTNGNVLYYQTITEDITYKKQVEEALRESEEKYRGIFENATEGIYQTTPEGRYLSANPSLARMLGFESPEELITTFPSIIGQYVDPHDREKLINIYKEKGHVEGFEIQFFKKDRSKIWVVINGHAVKGEHGEILYNEGFITDITERKLAEDSLKAVVNELKAKNVELHNTFVALKESEQKMKKKKKMASLGMLSAGVAHEIKNPLGIILQGVEFIESSISDPSLLDVAGVIKKSTLRADKIVKDLLSFARKTPPVFESLNIVSVIEETLVLVEHQMSLKNIQVIRRFSPDLPDIKADGGQLKQVLINILLNSIDAMPNGGEIIINLLHIDTERDGQQYLYIGITDTGSGIPEEEVRNIFDPFYTTKRETGGSGLGLPVSKGLVERHGGTMTIQSEVGKGTTVTIKIPYN